MILILVTIWQVWLGAATAHAQAAQSDGAAACPASFSTGGGTCISGPVILSQQEQAILRQKNALAREYARVRAGTLNATTFQRDLQAFLRQVGNPRAARLSATTQPFGVCCPSPGSNAIVVPQQSQQTGSYCGPATADAILLALGWTTGPHGESLSQKILAGSAYLQTDALGQTPWSTSSDASVMVPTLNAWTRSSFYVAFNGSGVGGGFSTATFTNSLTSDVDLGWPLAGNVVEDVNGPHLTGHPPSVQIFHWIAIKGYSNYGDNTIYADSVYGVPTTSIWWAGGVTSPYSTILTTNMVSMLNGRGYVW